MKFKLCKDFIHGKIQYSIDDIVNIIKEMDFFIHKTKYRMILKQTIQDERKKYGKIIDREGCFRVSKLYALQQYIEGNEHLDEIPITLRKMRSRNPEN
jgi:uncharacterized protein YeeX (DUF496 family)